MLPKSTEEVLYNWEEGNSVIIVGKEREKSIALYSGTVYDLTDEQQHSQVGMHLIEFGTEIANERYRGMGLGQLGVEARKQRMDELYGENYVAIATIKQHNTGNAWRKGSGGEAAVLDWYEHPHIAFLTDVCEGLTPTDTGMYCPLRRSIENSRDQDLWNATNSRGEEMPCSLITLHPDRAKLFESKAHKLHSEINPNLHINGRSEENVSYESFQEMQAFWESISVEV